MISVSLCKHTVSNFNVFPEIVVRNCALNVCKNTVCNICGIRHPLAKSAYFCSVRCFSMSVIPGIALLHATSQSTSELDLSNFAVVSNFIMLAIQERGFDPDNVADMAVYSALSSLECKLLNYVRELDAVRTQYTLFYACVKYPKPI